MSELSAGNAKLVQYLNEAYGTEVRLETALQAHISMTSSDKYRRRLKDHLSETRRHAGEVKQRIKRLGGSAQVVPAPGPDILSDAAGALIGGAERAVALAQGPLRAVRGTGEAEKQLKNARTEYASEAEEIAAYTAIETLAELLDDAETRQLARSIRRDEERMLGFLEREINTQTKAVARAEIPSAERRTPRRKRPAATRKAKAPARKAKTPGPKAKASAPKVKPVPTRKPAAASTPRSARPRRALGATASATKPSARRRPPAGSRRLKPRTAARSAASPNRSARSRATTAH